jgi:ribonuclease J
LVGRPDIVSRGFVDVQEARRMIEEGRDFLTEALNHQTELTDWNQVTAKIKDALSGFFYEKTRRRPIITPVLVKV